MKKKILLPLLLVLLTVVSGCQTPLSSTPHKGPWTLSELENIMAGDDPIEPYNRTMFAACQWCADYPLDWLVRGYTSILPRPVIDCLDNLYLNLEFPARCVSMLCRAQWKGAGDECLRFLANSTLGIGGLFDVGEAWFDLHTTESDFGQAFENWGIAPGCTVVTPILMRHNMRDLTGYLFDYAFDGKTYIPYSSGLLLNRLAVKLTDYKNYIGGSSDPYKDYRQLMTLYRHLLYRLWLYKVWDHRKELLGIRQLPPVPAMARPAGVKGKWCDLPEFGVATPEVSSMRQVAFLPKQRDDKWYLPHSIFNKDFINQGSFREISMVKDAPKLRYGFWKAPKPGDYTNPDKVHPEPKLAVVLPGIGGYCDGSTPIALAELLNGANFSVVTLDCAFSDRFMKSTGGTMPGFANADAAKLRKVIRKVLDDLESEKLIDLPQITLIGYSFGGFYTLKIAELEAKENQLNLQNFVAINPPGSLLQAAKKADSYSKAGSSWSPKEMVTRMEELAGKSYVAATKTFPPQLVSKLPVFAPPEEEANLLCFLFFRLPLRPILMEAQKTAKTPLLKTPYSWFRRNKLYLEIDKIGFQEYARRFIVPAHPELSEKELFAKCDLAVFGPGAMKQQKLTVIHNWDDPLLIPAQRDQLNRIFGKRMLWFSRGGHLGGFYLPKVQQEILKAAE